MNPLALTPPRPASQSSPGRASILAVSLALAAALAPDVGAQTLPDYVRCDVTAAPSGQIGRGAVGDFDRNGTPDLAFVDSASNQLVVIRTNRALFARGSCPEGSTRSTPGAGNRPEAVASGDVEPDGDADLVVANRDGVLILLGDGEGGFSQGAAPAAGSGPSDVAVEDLTGNLLVDLVVGNSAGNGITILTGMGGGLFEAEDPIVVGQPVSTVAVADLNQDARPDIVTLSDPVGNPRVFIQDADMPGTFLSPISLAVGTAQVGVGIADFDRDGVSDLVFVTSGAVSDGEIVAFRGQLNGSSVSYTEIGPRQRAGTSPSAIAVGDLDMDGRADLAITDQNESVVRIFLGDGNLGFDEALVRATGSTPREVLLADVDGDLRPDLITANEGPGNVSFFLSSEPPPTPTFTPTQTLTPSPTPTSTGSPTPSHTTTATATETATRTPTRTRQPSPTPTHTAAPTVTQTKTPGFIGLEGESCSIGTASGDGQILWLLPGLVLAVLSRRRPRRKK